MAQELWSARSNAFNAALPMQFELYLHVDHVVTVLHVSVGCSGGIGQPAGDARALQAQHAPERLVNSGSHNQASCECVDLRIGSMHPVV